MQIVLGEETTMMDWNGRMNWRGYTPKEDDDL
jgi:hypothetical protein